MGGFGWIVGIDPCEHLSNADTAAFSCVLGMPWARTTANWTPDPSGAPVLTQADCAVGFDDWLMPWKGSTVTWQLWAWDGTAVAWKRIPTATVRPVARAPAPTQSERLRGRCVDRLEALVRGHSDAMSFVVEGENGQRLSYPVVSPGVALRPTPVSEQVLGASSVITVSRVDLPAQDGSVVALPVFTFNDGTLAPSGGPGTAGGDLSFAYGTPAATRSAGGVQYQFTGCVTRSVFVPRTQPVIAPTPLRIGGGLPDAQWRATVSREFYSLRLWLESQQADNVGLPSGREFVARLVRLLGGGEDELTNGAVVGSVYELILSHDEYRDVFGIRDNALRLQKAAELDRTFDALLVGDAATGGRCAAWMLAFYQLLKENGLDESGAHADALREGATSAAPAIPAMLEAAKALLALVSSTSFQSCAAWCCWFAVLTPALLPPSVTRDALVRRLNEGARDAMRSASAGECPVLPDDVLRLMNGQIDRAAGFWEALHAATDLEAQLLASKSDFVAAFAGRLSLTPTQLEAFGRSYDVASRRLLDARPTGAPEADDSPLRLYYRAAATPSDERIRGCVLAMRVGAPDGAGVVRWKAGQWLTNFHAALPADNAPAEIVQGVDNAPILFCDTQGGTMSDGLPEQVCAYGGEALFAAPAQGASSAADMVFAPVPTGAPVPRLAFGAYYTGLSGTVDNAGVIMEASLREAALPGQPVAALDAGWFPGQSDAAHCHRYLSCQPPGLATFAGVNDWSVASETLSFEALATDRTRFKAAVLFDGDDYQDACPRQDLRLLAPSVSPSFMTRWLEADRLVGSGDGFRWDRVRDFSDERLDRLLATASPTAAQVAGKRTALGLSHPAISTLRMSVTWYSEAGSSLGTGPNIDVPIRHLNGDEWIRDESFPVSVLRVQSAAERNASLTGDRILIAVPKGMRARVEVRSVIDAKLLVGEVARLQASAMLDKFADAGGPFVSVLAETLWVESLPDCTGHPDRRDFGRSDFKLVLPTTALSVPEMSVSLQGDLPATWLRGFAIEQKRWQWSGYPVDFPEGPDLDLWLSLYAGTTNEAPALPGATFSTTVTTSGWRLKGVVMKPVPLAATRPALHMGVELTPILRFAKLLKSRLRSRETVFLYDILMGTRRAPDDRLAPPVWDEAIPLPQTASSASEQAAGLGHGNLLVLHDPVYDTADSAPFGGIAERIELDVVATWSARSTGHGKTSPILEAGPNPIFHGNVPLPDLDFTLDAPFGLGYDLVVGGRPAQTGLVVRPRNARGRWVMAKCWMRRIEIPDHVLGSDMRSGSDGIGWRRVEEEFTPQDFAVYTEAALASLVLGGVSLNLPVFDGTFARCYFVSWHKNRWASATPTWRAQINLYERVPGKSSWSLRKQVSGFGQKDFVPDFAAPARLSMKLGTPGTVHSVRASDYTEARWLTFIGSFGLNEEPLASDFRLRTDGSSFVLQAAPGKTAPIPVMTPYDQNCSSMLLVYAPGLDLLRGSVAQEGGELIGVYGFSNASAAGPARFDRAMLAIPNPDKIDWHRCHGVVIQLQRVDTTPPIEPGGSAWAEFVGQLFPDESPALGPQLEASLRFLPEYIAPIEIVRA